MSAILINPDEGDAINFGGLGIVISRIEEISERYNVSIGEEPI